VAPEPGMNIEVEEDATRTAHILVNLIMNILAAGRDFEVPNPRVEIIVSMHTTEEVSVSVKNSGSGLPEDRIDGLFKEFRRAKEGGVALA
jgi:signal transduction histidine kinase